jgi:transposase-like protein
MALSLNEYQHGARKRKAAMTQAYLSGAYTMAELGDHFGVHSMTVSRAVRECEGT